MSAGTADSPATPSTTALPTTDRDGGSGPDPVLSIIVVTWNCRELALRCLQEVASSTIGCSHEVLVVDNASRDGTVPAIAAADPSVRVIANTANAGFARANNQAIALARGRYLLLLNPDAFPTGPGTFAGLIRAMEAHPGFAAMGCRLVHADGRHQVGDAGWRPTPWHMVSHGLGLPTVLPGARGVFLIHPGSRHPATPRDVDWISGACLLLRAEAVRQHGAFDERFFMYAEDVELGCRLRSRGLRLGYLADETVMHLQGGTQADGRSDGPGGAGASTAWLDSLANLYAAMNDGRHWFAFRAAFGVGYGLRAILYRLAALRGRPGLIARSAAMAVYARHAWRMPRPRR